MKNPKSLILIVAVSLLIGGLHFVLGPGYEGWFRPFVTGYLMDLLLPMDVYLLSQVALRKHYRLSRSRWYGALGTFAMGIAVELLQFKGVPLFGRTFDPLDLLMYALGVGLGLGIDLWLLARWEGSETGGSA